MSVANEENTTEIAVLDSSRVQTSLDNLGAKGGRYMSTLSTVTFAEKLAIAEAMTSADNLADHLGEVIHIAGFTAQPAQARNNQTNELRDVVRVVLIDKGGKAYASMAEGVQSSLNTFAMIFGDPRNWASDPIPAYAVQERTKSGNMIIKLNVSKDGKTAK